MGPESKAYLGEHKLKANMRTCQERTPPQHAPARHSAISAQRPTQDLPTGTVNARARQQAVASAARIGPDIDLRRCLATLCSYLIKVSKCAFRLSTGTMRRFWRGRLNMLTCIVSIDILQFSQILDGDSQNFRHLRM
eukprot:6176905-Pleurochrysis_carterae.AAC.1